MKRAGRMGRTGALNQLEEAMIAQVQTSVDDALAELDNLDDEVPAWKPDVGGNIVAMVLVYDTFPSNYNKGTYYHVVTLRTAEGDFQRLTITPKALRGLFGRLRPKVGEWIKLKRLPNGEKANRYRMRVLGRKAHTSVPDDFGAPEATDTENVTETHADDATEVTANVNELDGIPF